MQPGVTAHYAAQAYEVAAYPDRLVVLATTRPIKHRGDTLAGPVLTLTIRSPLEGVVRVSVEHYSASCPPRLHVPMPGTTNPAVRIEETDERVTLTSGALSVDVRKGEGWQLTFREGDRVLTRSDWRSLAYVQYAGQGNFLHEQLTLQVGESVYGLGERFTPWVKNGQVVENTNKDGGTACEQAYKSVPFYLTNRGYGVLVNEAGPVSFEVASEKTTRVQFSREGESLDYCVVAGPTQKDVLRRLTALTGRAPLPPAWSFGLWMTTSFTTQYDEATATHFIDEMKRRELPLAVFHFDCFWMREFEWVNFQWDPRGFPDPQGMLARLKAKGLKISLWINPYVAQKSALFAEGAREGYFIKRTNGLVWQTDLWQPGMAIVDFTNPAATAWYQGHLRRLLAMGVDCFKTDFGERIPTEDVVYHDGSDPVEMHNLYALQYNEAVYRLLEDVRGEDEALLFARSTYASGQRYPVHWGGDCWSNFESMAESLRGGLSLTSCGFAFWSHDIGGFAGFPGPTPELYRRWLPFGMLTSHSRCHGAPPKEPWLIGAAFTDEFRRADELKYRLMPYVYAQAKDSSERGLPMLRALFIEFPEDAGSWTVEDEYLFGSQILVAPLVEAGATGRDVYLPPGQWIDYQTGKAYAAGWHRIEAGRIPVVMLVRDGAVIPHIALAQSTMQMDWSKLDLVVFASGDQAEGLVCLPSDRVLRKVSVAKRGDAFAAATDALAGKASATVKLYSAAGIPGVADSK